MYMAVDLKKENGFYFGGWGSSFHFFLKTFDSFKKPFVGNYCTFNTDFEVLINYTGKL